jgi:hypothetical protein
MYLLDLSFYLIQVPLVIGGVILIAYLFSLFFSYISKITGTTIAYRRNIVSTPDDFDSHVENIKKVNTSINNLQKNFLNKFAKMMTQSQISLSDSFALLNELEELKTRNIITDSEYSKLKEKIIGSIK